MKRVITAEATMFLTFMKKIIHISWCFTIFEGFFRQYGQQPFLCYVQGPPSFLVFCCGFYLGQFPSNNSDCLSSGDRGSEILCPTMRLPEKSCKKGFEANNPFHFLPAQQRTESKIFINFPSEHINLKVSRRQNSIKSSQANSHFTL
jgi:hypothetical protein